MVDISKDLFLAVTSLKHLQWLAPRRREGSLRPPPYSLLSLVTPTLSTPTRWASVTPAPLTLHLSGSPATFTLLKPVVPSPPACWVYGQNWDRWLWLFLAICSVLTFSKNHLPTFLLSLCLSQAPLLVSANL